MKVKDREINPLMKAYILIIQINEENNINNSLQELKKMCKIYGDEFIKNVYLLSFNKTNFKNIENQEKEKSFFVSTFQDFIANPNFIQIFKNILLNTQNENSINEIFNGLNGKLNLTIEEQLKLIISFIESGIEAYKKDADLLFLEKCCEIYNQKKFLEFKNNNIIEKIINILFNILKIKNREDNKDSNDDTDTENKSDIYEEKIKLYIQSFSHYNEQLKNDSKNKENNDIKNLENNEKNNLDFNINNTETKIFFEKLIYPSSRSSRT